MMPERSETDGAAAGVTMDAPCTDSRFPNTANVAGRRVRIVGLGTPFGDDRAGWEVVTLLRNALPSGTRADITSDPFLVSDGLPGDELLIVIDACRGSGPPGSVHRFEWPDSRLTANGGISSHGVGLTAALELAGVLGRLPQHVIVFAIEGTSADPGTGLSQPVEAALPEVAARVLAEFACG
jgi:hydrogenase maturation protease